MQFSVSPGRANLPAVPDSVSSAADVAESATEGVTAVSSKAGQVLMGKVCESRPLDDNIAPDDRNLVFVGELRMRNSAAPVFAIRTQRGKRHSMARAVAMKMWWRFASRFWPCAEHDNEW